MNRPRLRDSRRRMRSLYSPPDQTSPFLSAVTSYGHAPGVGAGHSWNRLGPRVEHPDPIGAVLAEPEAVLRVHHAAPRPRAAASAS